MSHNSRLRQFLSDITVRVNDADSKSKLIEAVLLAKSFSAPLKFDNKIPIISGIMSLLALVAVYYLSLENSALREFFGEESQSFIDSYDIYFYMLLPATSIFSFLAIYSRECAVSDISDKIHTKCVLFDNQLSQVQLEGDREQKKLAKVLKQEFKEFDRGNYSRKINKLYESVFDFNGISYPYKYYDFEYVDERTVTETSTDEKGNTTTKTRTEYDHYHRYGILTNIPYAKCIYVLSHNASNFNENSYRPASIRFNKEFIAKGGLELSIAKFLKPSVVLAFESIAERFSRINFELNEDSNLCLSFDDSDIMQSERMCGIETPDEFIAEINLPHKLEKLESVLEFFKTLIKHTDNNFMEP